jgi:hypothetical protein
MPLHPLNKPQLHELGPRQLNKPSLHPMKTLNTLQLCKLGTCQLNKLSFPLNHHKSVTQYVRTMKPSPLYKSPPTTSSPSTKSAH